MYVKMHTNKCLCMSVFVEQDKNVVDVCNVKYFFASQQKAAYFLFFLLNFLGYLFKSSRKYSIQI